ncbi:liprin-beta-1-like [Petromyzon marinus]|uniref:liprin-beta-1-like n=1 Tax=Petromyzon marinus TaxID=7757 RepID=UPI003F6F7533
MESDASRMLAAAIQQVDGIIAAQSEHTEKELEDTGGGAGSWALATRNGGGEAQAVAPWDGLQVVHLTEELCQRLERLGSQEEREGLRRQLPPGTVRALLGWLHASTVRQARVHGAGTRRGYTARVHGAGTWRGYTARVPAYTGTQRQRSPVFKLKTNFFKTAFGVIVCCP